MPRARSREEVESAASTRDAELDALLRSIAHAPPRVPPVDPADGQRWGAGGRYIVEKRIGRGGMGTVYLASDTLLGRQVALKVLYGGQGDDAQRARLLREARLAARLEHDRVARVYDVGEHEGSAFVAMEYVRGVTLRAWMAERARTPDEVLALVEHVAEGLAVLHASGVIHRDLKPENVMLSASGGVKLLDFGLARDVARAAVAGGASIDQSSLDQRGVARFLGTPGYMAPEQCLADPVGAAADVFALGVVLFELVTGERPFKGKTLGDVMRATVHDAPDWSAPAWDRYPAAARSVTERMLSKEVEKRYDDGAAALRAIRNAVMAVPDTLPAAPRDASLAPAWRERADPAARPPARRRTSTWLALGAAAAVAVSIGGLALHRRARAGRSAGVVMSGMVRLSGGEFTIGRTPEERETECARLGAACLRDKIDREQPAHAVRVSPYYLDVYETTNAQFCAWLARIRVVLRDDEETHARRYVYDATGLTLLVDTSGYNSGLAITADGNIAVVPDRETRPVAQVTWDAARLYCASLGKRLPTEAEWEYAARGATGRRFPWGDDEPRCDGVIFARMPGQPCEAMPHESQPVTAGDQDWTPERVHGLGGNVSEWVEDAFVMPYYVDCGSCIDPVQAPSPDAPADVRVMRGGGWANTSFVHASARGRWERDELSASLGIRCALPASE